MRVLISGGHLTPALALVDYLRKHHSDVELVFIGREFARLDQPQEAHERREVTSRGVTFIALHSGKLILNNPIKFIIHSVSLVLAILRAAVILLQVRPSLFVSFGSYLAVPIAVAAWFLRIPIITHEQTKTAGTANKIIGFLSQKIAISHPESATSFNKQKVVLTGNLIREQVLKKEQKVPEWFTASPEMNLLYITGGSQGSEVINAVIGQSLKLLLKEWIVIHQCGSPSGSRNYVRELEQSKNHLSARLQQRYFIREWVQESELSWIYTVCTAAISRAGANTVEELALRAIPTIFIPLPFSLNDEQYLNAKTLSDQNQAILLPQKELTPDVLLNHLEHIRKQTKKFKNNLENYSSQSRTALPKFTQLVLSTAN